VHTTLAFLSNKMKTENDFRHFYTILLLFYSYRDLSHQQFLCGLFMTIDQPL